MTCVDRERDERVKHVSPLHSEPGQSHIGHPLSAQPVEIRCSRGNHNHVVVCGERNVARFIAHQRPTLHADHFRRRQPFAPHHRGA